MDDRLKDGLRIGNFVVLPKSGTISGAQGSHRLSADRIEILLALAARPGESIPNSELAEIAGLDAEQDLDVLTRHIDAIRESLGDTGPNPRFIVVDEEGATLIAPVTPGVGETSSLDESDENVSFFRQLQRRKVIRVGAGYIVLAWVAIQVSDVVFPALGWPHWVITAVIALAMLGFPVSVVVAWLFEVTPSGTLRDERRMPARLSRKQKAIDVSVLASLAVVVGYFAVNVAIEARRARDQDALGLAEMVMAASNTIAVLPFEYSGGSEESSYIADGIAEEVLRLLSRLRQLRVAARTASFYFKDTALPIPTVANRLQVRHLLTGTVQVAGGVVRVRAELFDAVDGQILWAEVFDREMLDIFEIQSEIAKLVADSSEIVLSDEENARLAARPTQSGEAYDFYLRGRDYLRQPRTRDVLDNAQRLFHRALALDPGYALALAGLCETHLAVYIRTRSTATVDDAESVCQAALEADESLPEVHTALGYLFWHTGDFERSERQFRRAIEIETNFYEAYAGLGDALYSQNKLDESGLIYVRLTQLQPAYWRSHQKLGAYYYRLGKDALALESFRKVTELTPDNAPGWNNLGAVNFMLGNLEDATEAWERAIEISPTQSMYANLGTMYYYLGRFEDAVEMQRKALELTPDDFRMWGRLAAAYKEMPGHEAEADAAYNRGIELATEILEVNPNESDAHKNIALFYAHTGEGGFAARSIERALQLTPEDPDTHFFAALSYLELGDRERCLQELERAVALGYSKKLIDSEHAFDPIRDLDRFRILVAEAE